MTGHVVGRLWGSLPGTTKINQRTSKNCSELQAQAMRWPEGVGRVLDPEHSWANFQ